MRVTQDILIPTLTDIEKRIDRDEIGIIDFLDIFSEDFCSQYLLYIKYPNGIIKCPFCNHPHAYVTSRGYKCSKCLRKFSLLKGTVFENTNFPLRHWFMLIYNNSINKKNLSSVQLGRNFGSTQGAMWKMQSKIRGALRQNDELKLSGVIEIDETFCAKGNRWKRWGGFSTRKEPVIGLVERGGPVIIKIIPDRSRETIIRVIENYVLPGSTIYSDGWNSYRDLTGYNHDWVNHSSLEFVRDSVHTNTIENVWSHFKKSIRNAHHAVSAKHLQSYLDEAAFKYNNRRITQMERFNLILKRCCEPSK